MTTPRRTTLALRALNHQPKFALCRFSARAARVLHVPGERMQESLNRALAMARRAN